MADRDHGPRLPLKPPKRARKGGANSSEHQVAGASGNAPTAGESALPSPAPMLPKPWSATVASVGGQLAGQRYSSSTNPTVHGSAALKPSAPLASTSTRREDRISHGPETWLSMESDSPLTALACHGLRANQERRPAPPPTTAGPTQGRGNFLFGVRLPDHVPHPLSGISAMPLESRRALLMGKSAPRTEGASATPEAQPLQQASSSAAVLPTRLVLFGNRPSPQGPVSSEGRALQRPRELSWSTLSQRPGSADYDLLSRTRQASESREGGGPGPSINAGRQASGIVSAGISERANTQASRGAAAKAIPRSATALNKRHSYEEAIRHEFASCQTRIRRWEREMLIRGIPQSRLQTLERTIEEENSTLKTLERRRRHIDSDFSQMENMCVAYADYCGYIKKVQRENNSPKSRCHLFRKELEKLVRQESTFDNTRFIAQYLRVVNETNAEMRDRCLGLNSSAPTPSEQIREEGHDFGRTARDTPVRGSASKAAVAWSCAAEDSDAEADPTPIAPQTSDPDFAADSGPEISDAEVSTLKA